MNKSVKIGLIYLVQPAELVDTFRYKLGCSANKTLKRVLTGYKNGTRYLHVSECVFPSILEKKLKDNFNKHFKLIAGREYFEGNEHEMLKRMYDIIADHNDHFTAETIIDPNYKILSEKEKIIEDAKQAAITLVNQFHKKPLILPSQPPLWSQPPSLFQNKYYSDLGTRD